MLPYFLTGSASTHSQTPHKVECGTNPVRRRKRSTDPADDIDVHYPYPFLVDTAERPPIGPWPTPSGITEAEATQACEDAAHGASPHDLCHNRFGDDIYLLAIAACVEDIRVS